MTTLKEEEAGRSRGQVKKKRTYVVIIHRESLILWSHVHDHLAGLFIIHRESLIFFGEIGRMLL